MAYSVETADIRPGFTINEEFKLIVPDTLGVATQGIELAKPYSGPTNAEYVDSNRLMLPKNKGLSRTEAKIVDLKDAQETELSVISATDQIYKNTLVLATFA